MVKVWIKCEKEQDAEKVDVAPDSDIDALKTKVLGHVSKGQYRAHYNSQVLQPSASVPQNTTDHTPIIFIKISIPTAAGKW